MEFLERLRSTEGSAEALEAERDDGGQKVYLLCAAFVAEGLLVVQIEHRGCSTVGPVD